MSMGALGNDENATQVLQKALLHAPQKVGFCSESEDSDYGDWRQICQAMKMKDLFIS